MNIHCRRSNSFPLGATILLIGCLYDTSTTCRVAGQQFYSTSYTLTVDEFTSVESTIPPNFPQNQSDYDWQNSLDWENILYWDNWGAIPPEFSTFCLGNEVPTNFSVWPANSAQLPVTIAPSASGLLVFNDENRDPAWFNTTTGVPQPDLRLYGYFPSAFSYGYNYDHLWDVTETSIQTASIQSRGANSTSIYLVRGSLISFLNSSHSDRYTTLDFQLQLHQSTGDIVMHIIRLENATAEDIAKPILFGLIDPGDGSIGSSVQATMWMNNEFQREPIVSKTLRFSVIPNTFSCTYGTTGQDCPTCEGAGCTWCESTSTCVWQWNNSALCPDVTGGVASTSMCPAASFNNCRACIAIGNTWCSGEASTFVTQQDQNADICSAQSWWTPPQHFTPYCIAPNGTCGSQTCGELYGSAHVSPGTGIEAGSCVCDTGWITKPLCNVCDTTSGYFVDSSGNCISCPNFSAGIIIALVIVAIIVTFLLVKLNSHPLIQRMMVPIQNSVVYFQTISLLALIDFHWPLAVKHTFSVFSVIGLNLFHIPSVSCVVTPTETLAATILAPPLIGLFLGICVSLTTCSAVGQILCPELGATSGIATVCCPCCIAPKQLPAVAAGGAVGGLTSNRDANLNDAPHRRVGQNSFGRAFISFLLLYYNFLCYTIFQRSTSIPTFPKDADGSHAAALVIACMIVYMIGIPTLFTFLVWRRNHTLFLGCEKKWKSQVQQPLIARYREGCCQYWEAVVVPLWKLLLNAIIVYGAPKRTVQIVLLVILLVAIICLYTFVRPYRAAQNNHIQQWLMSGSIIVLLSGVLFYIAEPNTDRQTSRTVLLVISYILVFATMIVMTAVIIRVIINVVKEYRAEQKSAQCLLPEYDRGEGEFEVESKQQEERPRESPSYQSME